GADPRFGRRRRGGPLGPRRPGRGGGGPRGAGGGRPSRPPRGGPRQHRCGQFRGTGGPDLAQRLAHRGRHRAQRNLLLLACLRHPDDGGRRYRPHSQHRRHLRLDGRARHRALRRGQSGRAQPHPDAGRGMGRARRSRQRDRAGADRRHRRGGEALRRAARGGGGAPERAFGPLRSAGGDRRHRPVALGRAGRLRQRRLHRRRRRRLAKQGLPPLLRRLMAALENRFSWSKSRHEKFEACLRQYYYQYYGSWGGWERDAPPEVRELYILKKLTNRHAWSGTAVHDAIRRILTLLRDGAEIDPERIVATVRASMRAQFRESRQGADGCRKAFGLREHEYAAEVAAEEWCASWGLDERCLPAFFRSRWVDLAGSLPHEAWPPIDELASFLYRGVPVFAAPDFAFRAGGGVVLVDWKTGKAREADRD